MCPIDGATTRSPNQSGRCSFSSPRHACPIHTRRVEREREAPLAPRRSRTPRFWSTRRPHCTIPSPLEARDEEGGSSAPLPRATRCP